jgi:endonuclease YncB( thermonuclease family)
MTTGMTDWLWPDSVVTRVIDGDSFEATVTRRGLDYGFNIIGTVTFPIKLRLARVNTPKANTAAGKAATAAVNGFLLGQTVTIQTLKGYKYSGGDKPEYMAEVTLPDGRNLSDELVFGGWAVFWDGKGPRPADS